jgi:ubiquinone/menaquinone biosynthesis C-methylase UbiE
MLDLGCGIGYTTEFFQKHGFDVVGLDVLRDMIRLAKKRGLHAKLGDMRELRKQFKQSQFDAVVSASALQWLKKQDDIVRVAQGVHYVLKPHGKMIIQFYPRSQDALVSIARLFKKHSFAGDIVIDHPDNPKKRTIYLVMQKKE